MKLFSVLLAIGCCAALSSPASACKSDYCNGSMAPTTLNQVGGGGGGGGG